MPAAGAPPLAPGPSSRATPKGRRTRERILDTAEALFAEHGFAGTTLRDVADAAGLRIPSLYNHFAGKEALYAAVLDRGIRPVLDLLGEAVAAGPEGPTRRRALVGRVLGALARRPALARLVQHEVLAGGERLQPVLRGWIKTAFGQAEETIRALPGARRWDEAQIPLLVMALYQVAVGYFAMAPLMRALRDEDLLSEEALARQTRFFGDLVAALLPDEE